MPDQRPDSPEAALVGQVIGGRYRLTKLLGQGGMGEVYAADHIHITKQVAVKLLHAEISTNAEAVARFKQEAQSASSIGHDNIIRIDDFFEIDDGRVCLCMEYLDGQSLDHVIHRLGAEDPVRGIRVICQVCDGLGAAHAKGIIHRDMKPENVFLSRKPDATDQVKILDFGIAKVTGGEANDLTKTGMVFGTPHYMSPEQALGHSVDPRSDIYSVGIMLFEMFTGEVPFKAESFMGVLSKHITQPPPSPSKITARGRVPDPVERIILKAMAKQPDKRFQSTEELKEALIRAQRAFGGVDGEAPAAPTRLGAPCPMEVQQQRPVSRVEAGDAQAVAPRQDVASAATMMSQQVPAKGTGTGPMAGEMRSPTAVPMRRGGRTVALGVGLVLMVGLGVGIGQLFGGAEDTRRSAARVPLRAADSAPAHSSTEQALDLGSEAVASAQPRADAGLATTGGDGGQRRSGNRTEVARAQTPRDAGGAPDARRQATAVADARVQAPKVTRRPPDARPSHAPIEAPRAFYEVTLVTVPADAAVYRGNSKMRSRTPMKLKVRPGERIRLRLAKAGRKDREVTIVGEKRDRTVRVTLKRRGFDMPGGTEAGSSDGIQDDF